MKPNDFELKDTTTVFLLPFSFDEEYLRSLQKASVWEINNIRVDKSAFYPHIYKFLVENYAKGSVSLNHNNCLIYSLKDKWDSVTEDNKCIAKLFSKQEFEIKPESDKEKLYFRILNEKSKLSSPKLMLYPLASVGFLMISIELTGKERTVGDLINLNYRLHKITSSPPAIQISLPKNAHIERAKEADKIYQALANYNFKENKTKKEEEHRSWYFHNLFLFLLSDFNTNTLGVKIFNKARFHLFTHLHVDSAEKLMDGQPIENDDLIKDFIRLARCQNKKYKVFANDMGNNTIYMQTFENIYVASCVEGTCIMLDSQGTDSEFFNDFKNDVFFTRYLWIYLLIFLQKHTLIELTEKLLSFDTNMAAESTGTFWKKFKKMVNLDTDIASDSMDNLGKLVSDLSKMKINSAFASISDHTQHNTFYWFCSEKLLVNKHLQEVKDKIGDVDIILRDRIDQSNKRQSRRLEWVLAILMISQIYFAMVSFYHIEAHWLNWLIKRIPIVFIVLILILLWFRTVDMMKSSKR